MGPVIWSDGGGTQSAAIAAGIVTGRLPKPDLACIADTSREMGSTWVYHEEVIGPALRSVGVEVHIIPHAYSTVDLHSSNGKLLIPAFTSQSVGGGKLPTFCSNEWKQRPVRRWATEQMPDAKAFDVWLGFSTDEVHRCKGSGSAKWVHVFPLIEMMRMSRAEAVAFVVSMGWPLPPRSSCWMCPNKTDREWRELPGQERELAARFEREIRKTDPHVWLHKSMQPLGTIDFNAQADMFEDEEAGCHSGYCFT